MDDPACFSREQRRPLECVVSHPDNLFPTEWRCCSSRHRPVSGPRTGRMNHLGNWGAIIWLPAVAKPVDSFCMLQKVCLPYHYPDAMILHAVFLHWARNIKQACIFVLFLIYNQRSLKSVLLEDAPDLWRPNVSSTRCKWRCLESNVVLKICSSGKSFVILKRICGIVIICFMKIELSAHFEALVDLFWSEKNYNTRLTVPRFL